MGKLFLTYSFHWIMQSILKPLEYNLKKELTKLFYKAEASKMDQGCLLITLFFIRLNISIGYKSMAHVYVKLVIMTIFIIGHASPA